MSVDRRPEARYDGDPIGRVPISADIRRDRLTGTTTLVVPRWEPPKAADPARLTLQMPTGTTPCPFCPAQMDDPASHAGEETARVVGGPRHGPWSALALRNRWPHTLDPTAAELVVLSVEHDAHLGNMPADEAALAVGLMVERADEQRRRGLHPLIFVNHGTNAGSSQPHPHGQVIGLPEPEPLSLVEAPALVPGSCVLCERAPDDRFITRLSGASVITPEAPAVDYDQLVVQSGHRAADPKALVDGVGCALQALWDVVGPVAYNLVLHVTAHPHVHVTPRTARHSGYGLAGIQTCYVAPATANARLAEAVSRSVELGRLAEGGAASRSDAA